MIFSACVNIGHHYRQASFCSLSYSWPVGIKYPDKGRMSWGSGPGRDMNCEAIDVQAYKMGDKLTLFTGQGCVIKSIQVPSHSVLRLQDQGQLWEKDIGMVIGFWLHVLWFFSCKPLFFGRETQVVCQDADVTRTVTTPSPWSSPCLGPRVSETLKATENQASCRHTLGINPIATSMGGEGY